MQTQTTEQKATVTVGEKINEFVQKHRKPIYISGGAVILLLVAGIAAISLMDFMRGKAIAEVEALNTQYEALNKDDISGENEDVTKLLADLETFAKKNSGYAGGRAWSIIGSIYREKKDWVETEAAWAAAAKVAGKTYLGPIALFNAGAAAEEQGKTDAAIEYYTASLASAAVFPAAPRAQFSIGRLQESRNQKDAAIEAYRAVVANWPYDSTWVNFAHSRIIALEAK